MDCLLASLGLSARHHPVVVEHLFFGVSWTRVSSSFGSSVIRGASWFGLWLASRIHRCLVSEVSRFGGLLAVRRFARHWMAV